MSAREASASRREAITALQRGAGRSLAAVLHARYPDLSFEISTKHEIAPPQLEAPRTAALLRADSSPAQTSPQDHPRPPTHYASSGFVPGEHSVRQIDSGMDIQVEGFNDG